MKTDFDKKLEALSTEIELFRMSNSEHVGCNILYRILDCLEALKK